MQDLTRESILEAIQQIDANPELKKGRESVHYDLIHEGKKYPPILVLSEANKLIGRSEVTIRDFGNSTNRAFKLLREQGFNVVEKHDNYYEELKKFLNQSKTSDLKYSHYKNSFMGLKVRVSFGKGNVARIPWISFLGQGQTTQKGIYPVYLLYKDINKLILAYGISETEQPLQNWNLPDGIETIEEYFSKRNLGIPDRYGASYVFKVYDIENLPTENEIDKDLKILVSKYRGDLDADAPKDDVNVKTERKRSKFTKSALGRDIEKAGLLIETQFLTRFSSSLLTKPFVILTGLSGSGKTKLAQAFTQWISSDKDQYCVVPVGADWTNREPLLGYPNALSSEEYIKPDNGVLDLLIRANENPDLPYFLILDEMNLSHVERYFADFLSVMESNEVISLYSGNQRQSSDGTAIPTSIGVPPNLFLIGTVNIDETTYMFSPKVLDRANVIEFRVSGDEISSFLENPKPIDLSQLEAHGSSMAQSFLELAQNKKFENGDMKAINATLTDFFNELKKMGAEFGYRTANEIVRLINQLSVIDAEMAIDQKIDIAIMQKLLPKLHGSRRKLCPVLLTLGSFCIEKGSIEKIETDVFEKVDFDLTLSSVKYPISLEKLIRMHKCAVDNGYASYAEA